ncbi:MULTISPECIES: Fic family protein [unclassified Rhodanobacter]|uniref:protein adenylyltransferase Fic n=1 Tax=unclassified Rhodanobacter TaxID=2621553 RepID=UPI001BE0D7AD|nr:MULTISPECIES: Fic family protein [unclassified Rhodanobacter]MBT2144887.1 Fic family protein [Rhodanobacter sp. LX-99]MBT2148932.1 Fic family protein [Rhodanobacter sp. LX-100]
MPFDPLRPHDDLPALPPAADIESRPLLKACIEARAALAELKSVGAAIPNQAVLINTIPLLEAQASSEIENIVTTSDALFRFAQDEQAADPATKEALNYRAALREGFESLAERPLGTGTAVRVCSRLKNRDMDVRRVPGTALKNAATGEVVYTPPQGEALLRGKLANWERFIHDATDVDPLIRMAVAHYQFEAIHPFLDGNGRTGRVLNLLLLVEQGLLDQPVLYLSRHILRHRIDYYRRLLAVTRDGAWQDWIAFMLDAVAQTARWTGDKIRAIQALHAQATDFVRTHAPKIYSRELVDALFVQPYCRIQNLVDGGIAKRQTASVYLKQLADLGMLVEVKVGREKLFLHPNFVRLLTSDDHPVLPYGSTASRKD